MKTRSLAVLIIALYFMHPAYALRDASVEYFVSNNTQEIDLATAYQRLTQQAQHDLQNQIILLMQKQKLIQGQFQDILGAYRMATDNKITADNTEHITLAPNQDFSEKKAFAFAQTLARTLNQESVAVLIPHAGTIGGSTIHLTHPLSIQSVITLLHDKLPALYSQAFSLHLNHACNDKNSATVDQIEWLGSQIHPNEIKAAFPNDTLTIQYGNVYLIYQNGEKKPL